MYDSGTNYPEFWRRGSASLRNLIPSSYDVCELRPRFLIARHSPPLTCILVLAHRPFTAHNPLSTACLAIYTLLYDSPYPSPSPHVTYSALWTTVVHLLLESCRHHTIQVPGSDTVEECTRKLFTPDIDLISKYGASSFTCCLPLPTFHRRKTSSTSWWQMKDTRWYIYIYFQIRRRSLTGALT